MWSKSINTFNPYQATKEILERDNVQQAEKDQHDKKEDT